MTYGNGQGQPREPVEQIVDVFVHMPIGLAVMAWKRFPELVSAMPELVGQVLSKGCAQLSEAEERLTGEVRKARMIGQFAVTFGGRQLRREVGVRLRDVRRAAGAGPDAEARHGAPSVSTADTPTEPASPPAPASSAAKAAPARPAATKRPPKAKPTTATPSKPAKASGATRAKPPGAGKPGAGKPGASKPGDSKPGAGKPGAGKGNASGAAKGKAPGAGKAKASGAAKAQGSGASRARASGAPRRASDPASAANLPIREYDGLSASQVVSRLTGLTPAELQAVRSYEERSRGRRTVLLAIDRLLG